MGLAVLTAVSIIGGSGLGAFAQEIGVVDLYKVMSNYSKAQEISNYLNQKKAELQKFQEDGNAKIKEQKTDLQKQSLFDTLNTQYNKKVNEYNNDVEVKLQQLKQLQDVDVVNAVQQVAKDKNLDMIIDKSAVPFSKIEITDQVITILNANTDANKPSATKSK